VGLGFRGYALCSCCRSVRFCRAFWDCLREINFGCVTWFVCMNVQRFNDIAMLQHIFRACELPAGDLEAILRFDAITGDVALDNQ
jgi:hypothetical protein